MRGAVYVNGTITPADQAVVPVFDHGFLYGEGVYESLRTYHGVPFLYDRHVRACATPRATSTWTCRSTTRTLKAWVDATARGRAARGRHLHPHPADARRRRADLRLRATPAPSLVIIVKPLEPAPARIREQGIRIALVPILRNHPGSVNPIIKSNNLLNNALAMQEALRRGGEEALMCNYRGELSECSQSNFFLVRDGVALTPRSQAGLLEGITRAFLFEVGRDVGVEVTRRDADAGRPRDRRRGLHHQHDARDQPGRGHRRPDDRRRPPGANHAEAVGRLPPPGAGDDGRGGADTLTKHTRLLTAD